ncbi:MAG: HAD-IA family hydrolase, partial [Chitinivibrionales bacterium]|nr:HAD-IA family hydrolase [Chitinivibrionales bacterium]
VARSTQVRQENFLAMLKEKPLPPFPGVVELMSAALDSDNFKVAIATSSTREKSQAVLDSAGIPYKKLVYVTGSDVSRKKPDPELFVTAAKKVAVPPQKCVVIEDAPNGIEAAHRAGCRCIAVTNSASADKLSQADLIVASLKAVSIDKVRGLISGR